MDNQGTMRNNPPSEYTYLDQVFESEINNAIKLTDHNYSCTLFREAMKSGFYDLQVRESGTNSRLVELLSHQPIFPCLSFLWVGVC